MLLLPLGYTIAELLLLLLLHGCRNESDRRGEIQRGLPADYKTTQNVPETNYLWYF